MLFTVMGIIGRWFMYILTGIITIWLVYIFSMALINTVCDCSRALDEKRRGLIAPLFS